MTRTAKDGWRVGILGATGAVGRAFLDCLATTSIPLRELRLLASPRSAGSTLPFRGEPLRVEAVSPEQLEGLDLVLCSAGAKASGEWAPRIVEAGAWVVDNSSRWRMDPAVPLIVPEVNAHRLPRARGIIANPNCSTIQLVVALAPLDRAFGLRRVVVATYQSAAGKGQAGIQALREEMELGETTSTAFPHRLFGNLIPQVDVFLEDHWTKEEEKMLEESRKILELPGLEFHPTCVRVPVAVSHSESVFIETDEPIPAEAARETLRAAPGVIVIDDPSRNAYPTPLAATGTDAVYVGRIRSTRARPNELLFWVVADNLRKGAALNAVQIATALWRQESSTA